MVVYHVAESRLKLAFLMVDDPLRIALAALLLLCFMLDRQHVGVVTSVLAPPSPREPAGRSGGA